MAGWRSEEVALHKDQRRETTRVLLVEDDPADAAMVEAFLEEARGDYAVRWVDSMAATLEQLEVASYDAAIVDLNLGDARDEQVLRGVLGKVPELPVVVLTGATDEAYGRAAVRSGAQDFILKNECSAGVLSRAVDYSIERRRAAIELERLAHYDSLTGLPNRTLFFARIDRELRACLEAGDRGALLFIDVDRFKGVNDSLGHGAGDELLKTIAGRLQGALRATDLCCRVGEGTPVAARLGGDEFAIYLDRVGDEFDATRVADRLLEALAEPVTVGASSFVSTISVGIAVFPDDAETRPQLLTCADEAMYRAKRAGRNNWQLYSAHRHHFAQQRLQVHAALHRALLEDQFRLHYQPQFDLHSGDLVGLEALIRWQRTRTEMVPPGHFIGELENSGLIHEVGAWVIAEACREARGWSGAMASARVAVNVSASQILRSGFLDIVRRALAQTRLDPERLEIEVTEDSLLEDRERALQVLLELRDLGVRVAIDDFGTGYSSMDYLRRYPVNLLKLDRSFVQNIHSSARDAAIARSLVELSHQLGLEVVAEGIENAEQLALLRSFGCDVGQGYLLGRPAAQLPNIRFRHPPAQTGPAMEFDSGDSILGLG